MKWNSGTRIKQIYGFFLNDTKNDETDENKRWYETYDERTKT